MVEVNADYLERLKAVLNANFEGAEITLHLPVYGNKVWGRLIWRGFENTETLERQKRICDLLRNQLGKDAQGVSMILAYSPHDWELMQASDPVAA